MSKRKRRFGDRSDGYLLRSLPPLNKVEPYIMKSRNDATNPIALSADITRVEEYIAKKKAEGMKNFSYLHFFVACYVRTVSQRPGINRFISGQKIFSRYDITVMLAVKKKMALNAEETIIKCTFDPSCTAKDIYEQFNAKVEENKGEDHSTFDGTAKFFNHIPGLLLRFAIGLCNMLDYFGILPKFLLDVSPFHGSFFITSMGSLGIPPIYHHLYNFGNVPLFLSYGIKRSVNELDDEGKVVKKKYIDYKITTDERICDGHYFASALKLMNSYFNHPEVLDNPPEKIVDDVD